MLRSIRSTDLGRLLAIEQAVHVVPWSPDVFKMCLQMGHLGWVFEREQKILGFIMVSIANDECHILNIAVDRPYQHQGVGFTLLTHVLNYARKQHVKIAYLEVRRFNQNAIHLYEKLNFQMIGERKGYYSSPSGNEDALVFARCLDDNTKDKRT